MRRLAAIRSSTLEIARELVGTGARPAHGEAMPLPRTLADLATGRIAALPAQTRAALLVAAASADPTGELVARATAVDVPVALHAAANAGVVELDGDRIRFTHPLLSSAAYADASLAERQAAHQRLALVEADAEARARHAALGAPGPSERVASALERAAGCAHARGAPESAAELAELAAGHTPPSQAERRTRRTIQAAEFLFPPTTQPRPKPCWSPCSTRHREVPLAQRP